MKYWSEPPLKSGGKILSIIAAATALLLAQGSPPQAPSSTVSNDAAFRRVSNRLACQCSCPYLVSSCNMLDCNSATYIRKTIQTQLAEGKSEDAIVAGFVQQYGPRILSEPPQKGFFLTAWVMPFAVLLLGGALVSYVLWRWRLKVRPAAAGAAAEVSMESAPPPVKGPAPAPATALVEKYRAQIDRELDEE